MFDPKKLPANQPLTLRQAFRVILTQREAHGPFYSGPPSKEQRKSILLSILVVQKHTTLMLDDAHDVGRGDMPLGYNIPPSAELPWRQLVAVTA